MSIKTLNSDELTTFYRIEHKDSERSLWYRGDGTYDPFINKLSEGKAKILPMGFDEKYYDYGTKWYSALYDIENAHYWFSDMDVYELLLNDYLLYEITASNVRKEEHEIMFARESIVRKDIIPASTVWDIDRIGG